VDVLPIALEHRAFYLLYVTAVALKHGHVETKRVSWAELRYFALLRLVNLSQDLFHRFASTFLISAGCIQAGVLSDLAPEMGERA